MCAAGVNPCTPGSEPALPVHFRKLASLVSKKRTKEIHFAEKEKRVSPKQKTKKRGKTIWQSIIVLQK
jgi:hypothetical protein